MSLGGGKREWEQATHLGEVVDRWHGKASGEADGRGHRGGDAVPPVQSPLHHADLSRRGHLRHATTTPARVGPLGQTRTKHPFVA